MRLNLQFQPTKRRPDEGVLVYMARTQDERKKFDEAHKRHRGKTRDEQLQDLVPKFDEE